MRKYEDTWTLKRLINKYSACGSHENNSNTQIIRSIRDMMYPGKTIQNLEDEKPNKQSFEYAKIIADNDFTTLSNLLDKRHLSDNRE